MAKPQPYSLRPESHSSDLYYADIAAFANRWTASLPGSVRSLAEQFRAYQVRQGRAPRSIGELTFEFLVQGVLLHEHGHHAARLNGRTARLLAGLNRWQDANAARKPLAKRLRGWLGGLNRLYRATKGQVYATPGDLERLIRWLRAQGEETQAARFGEWLQFYESLPLLTARQALVRAWRLAKEFERASHASLGRYTTGVDVYRVDTGRQAQWRYDEELITRSRLEYHLGMLGTEILNRSYRERFRSSPQRLVIVPPCLRARPDELCQAHQTPLGAQCTGCTPTCRIFQITRLAREHGALATCIPDDELTKLCLSSGQSGGQLGVVGLACALRNWTAGWEADRLSLPAQGVLLDFAGCQKHWDEAGIPTDVNLGQLEELLALPRSEPTA